MIRANVVGPANLEGAALRVNLDSFALRLLAEGDSWFSAGSMPPQNLLQEMQFAETAVIVNLAAPGGDPRNGFRRMCDYGAEFGDWLSRDSFRFDAILLSCGGNDLFAAWPHLLRQELDPQIDPTRPELLVDEAAVALLEGYLVESFTGFVNVRDRPGSPNAGVPMFLHTFDYPTPNETPARSALGLPLGGPWLHPLLRERLPPAAWLPLAHYLVDRLAMILLALPARLPQLHVIDTRGTLIPAHLGATRESNDWDNEIHPNKGGYRKLAARLAAAVQRKLDM